MKKIRRKLRRNTLVKRWKSESPLFFKRLLKFSLTLGGIGGVIIATPILAFALPMASIFITAGTAGALVSKLTVENKKDIE